MVIDEMLPLYPVIWSVPFESVLYVHALWADACDTGIIANSRQNPKRSAAKNPHSEERRDTVLFISVIT